MPERSFLRIGFNDAESSIFLAKQHILSLRVYADFRYFILLSPGENKAVVRFSQAFQNSTILALKPLSQLYLLLVRYPWIRIQVIRNSGYTTWLSLNRLFR